MAVVARSDGARADSLGEPASPPASSHLFWWGLLLFVGLCIPLLIAVIAFRRPVWTPVLDLAMTELRVRDVGGSHTPLIGLPGRIGTLQNQGSHPGPISFYALAPVYRLLGSTSWALQVGSFLVHAAAMATALWIAARRGGLRLVVAVAAILAALIAGYGGGALTEPWNPYLPVLWWLVVLLAVWSVLCGDLPMLAVAVLGASFCAQTHVPYLVLALGMGGLAIGGVVWHVRHHPDQRSRALRWSAAALLLGVALWIPPTLDQVRHDPGNYRQLIDHFSSPDEVPQGLRAGLRVGFGRLDVAHLFRGDAFDPGLLVTDPHGVHVSPTRGGVLLALWALAAVVAWRRRHAALMRLNLVVGLGVLLMVWSISRIFGEIWYYLTLWGWALGALALLSLGWTAAVVVGERWSPEDRERRARVATMALGCVVLLITVRFSVSAADSAHSDAPVAAELAAVMDDVVTGVEGGDGAATGSDGRYLVTWSDAYHIGSQGFGLVNELERHGYDVGVPSSKRAPATPQRVLDASDATARIHLATGINVDRIAEVPGAVEIARFDPRSDDERAEQAQLRDGVIADLRAMGRDELVPEVDANLFGAAIDQRLPVELRDRMGRMLEIGTPLAVFVLPPDSAVDL